MAARFATKKTSPVWLLLDAPAKSIRIAHVPKREEIDVPVEEQLVVEFYSR